MTCTLLSWSRADDMHSPVLVQGRWHALLCPSSGQMTSTTLSWSRADDMHSPVLVQGQTTCTLLSWYCKINTPTKAMNTSQHKAYFAYRKQIQNSKLFEHCRRQHCKCMYITYAHKISDYQLHMTLLSVSCKHQMVLFQKWWAVSTHSCR